MLVIHVYNVLDTVAVRLYERDRAFGPQGLPGPGTLLLSADQTTSREGITPQTVAMIGAMLQQLQADPEHPVLERVFS